MAELIRAARVDSFGHIINCLLLLLKLVSELSPLICKTECSHFGSSEREPMQANQEFYDDFVSLQSLFHDFFSWSDFTILGSGTYFSFIMGVPKLFFCKKLLSHWETGFAIFHGQSFWWKWSILCPGEFWNHVCWFFISLPSSSWTFLGGPSKQPQLMIPSELPWTAIVEECFFCVRTITFESIVPPVAFSFAFPGSSTENQGLTCNCFNSSMHKVCTPGLIFCSNYNDNFQSTCKIFDDLAHLI